MTAARKKPAENPQTETAAPRADAPRHVQAGTAQEKKSPVGMIAAVTGGLIVLLAVAAILNMGSMAKGLVEKLASDTLGTKVTLASLDIRPAEKTVVASGLRVDNPAGFKNPSALTVGKIAITAETLSPDLLVFKTVDVQGTDINMEVTQSTTNLTSIRNKINATASEKKAAGQQKTPPKVIIRELVFNGMRLNPSATLAAGDMRPIEISNLRMTGIGEAQNGVPASEVMAQVMEQITRTSVQAALQGGYLEGMSADALGALKSQMGIVESFGEQAKHGLESLKSGLRNLFGGGEQPQPAQQ